MISWYLFKKSYWNTTAALPLHHPAPGHDTNPGLLNNLGFSRFALGSAGSAFFAWENANQKAAEFGQLDPTGSRAEYRLQHVEVKQNETWKHLQKSFKVESSWRKAPSLHHPMIVQYVFNCFYSDVQDWSPGLFHASAGLVTGLELLHPILGIGDSYVFHQKRWWNKMEIERFIQTPSAICQPFFVIDFLRFIACHPFRCLSSTSSHLESQLELRRAGLTDGQLDSRLLAKTAARLEVSQWNHDH